MNMVKIQRLLKNSFSCKSHLDVIAENAKYPAIAYKHQSHSAARLLSGKKSGRSDQWTVEIVTKNDEDIKKLVDEAEVLHNTRTDDYLRVMVTVGNVGTQLKDEKLRSTLLTIQTYEA